MKLHLFKNRQNKIRISISYYTALGQREVNEDSICVLEGRFGTLALLADGLGGHRNGKDASSMAIRTLNEYFFDREATEREMPEAFRIAHERIKATHDGSNNMKTTLSALFLSGNEAIASHVGDSRIYQFRNGEILYQSLDHSVAQLAVMSGEIDKSELRRHPERHILIRALGSEKMPKVTTNVLPYMAGDRFLICSDGFWEPLSEELMLSLSAAHPKTEEWLREMRWIAENNAADNHSAIAITILSC